jgi:hypothetical protein
VAYTAAILGFLKACASGVAAYKGSLDNDNTAVATNTAAAFQTLATGLLKDLTSESWKNIIKASPTDPLEYAIAILSALECINGFGNPDKGAVLKDTAKSNFETAFAYLKLATPDPLHWSGAASTAYGALITKAQECVRALQAADSDLAGYVKNQANLVLSVRQKYTYTKAGLLGCIPIVWAVYAKALAYYTTEFWYEPELAETAAKTFTIKFQLGLIGAAFTELTGFTLYYVFEELPANTSAMRGKVLSQYDAARGLVPLPHATAAPQAVPTTPGSTVSAFPTLSGAGGNISVTSSRPYPVAGSEGGYGDSTTEHGSGDAPVTEPGQPEAPATPSTAATPSTPFTPAATSTPAFTAPTVSQTTQPTKPATAPGERATANESAPGADVERAGAAESAGGAERAPIEVAAGSPEQAQEASPGAHTPGSTSARSMP